MSKDNVLISQLFSEFDGLFTPEENQILLESDPVKLELLYKKKMAEACNHAALANMLKPSFCDFNTFNNEITFSVCFPLLKMQKADCFLPSLFLP